MIKIKIALNAFDCDVCDIKTLKKCSCHHKLAKVCNHFYPVHTIPAHTQTRNVMKSGRKRGGGGCDR